MEIIREMTPPILLKGFRRVFRLLFHLQNDYTYSREGWPKSNPTGWNTPSVVEAYESDWEKFVNRAQSTGPLELKRVYSWTSESQILAQNMKMVFAYAFGRAIIGKSRLKVLDWGGRAWALLYLGKEYVPGNASRLDSLRSSIIMRIGKKLLPEIEFTSNLDDVVENKYDLVFASSVLQYCEDWRSTACILSKVTGKWLLITRHPICLTNENFVLIQQSYNTTYPGWVLNRGEFLGCMEKECALILAREFSISLPLTALDVPESWEQRGFLFTRPVGE